MLSTYMVTMNLLQVMYTVAFGLWSYFCWMLLSSPPYLGYHVSYVRPRYSPTVNQCNLAWFNISTLLWKKILQNMQQLITLWQKKKKKDPVIFKFLSQSWNGEHTIFFFYGLTDWFMVDSEISVSHKLILCNFIYYPGNLIRSGILVYF